MHVCQQTCKALVTLLGRHLVVVVSRKVQVNSCVTGCWSHVLDTVRCGNAPEDLQRRHIMRLCGARLCQKRAKEDWRLFRPSLGMAVSDSSSPFCSFRVITALACMHAVSFAAAFVVNRTFCCHQFTPDCFVWQRSSAADDSRCIAIKSTP